MHVDWVNDIGLSPVSLSMAIAALVIAVAYHTLQNIGLPPGPRGVPFLGYWPFIDFKTCHLQFEALKKKYGEVFSFTVTGTLYIHLGTVKAVREAHVGKSDCFGRRSEVFNLMVDIFSGGVAFQNDEEWKTNRKFFMSALKERTSQSFQETLLHGSSLYDSVNSTVGELRGKSGDGAVNIVALLAEKCNTIVRRAMFGESVTDDVVREFNEYFAKVMGCMTAPTFLPTGNIARYILFPLLPGYRESKASLKVARSMLDKIIEEHKATYDEEHIRDIIDEYIREGKLRRSKGDPTAKHFTDNGLSSTLLQLVGDGSVSIAMFIALILKAVADHPEEQDKIYKELVEVVGTDRQPTIEDKSRLTYTNAFVQEAVRTSSEFFPFFPSQECIKETTLRGYRIPKGAITLMNIYSGHNDPEAYEHPEKFDPSRFIVQEGKQRPDLPMSFGIGKRACIGEGFTHMHIFLFLTTIIQNFHLSLPDGVKSIAESLMMGSVELVVKSRNNM